MALLNFILGRPGAPSYFKNAWKHDSYRLYSGFI